MFSGWEIAAATALPATLAAVLVWCCVPRRPEATALSPRQVSWEPGGTAAGSGAHAESIPPLAAWGLSVAIGLAMLASIAAREVQQQHAVARSLAETETPATLSEWWPAARAALETAWRPREARQWLPAIIVALLAITWPLLHLERRLPLLAWMVLAALTGCLVLRLLWGSVYLTREWSQGQAGAYLAGVGVGLGSLWWLGMRQDRHSDNDSYHQLFCASILTGCLAAVLASSGSLTLGFGAGSLAWALLGAWLAAWFDGRWAAPGGSIGPLVVWGGALLVLGYFYAEVEWTALLGVMGSVVIWTAWQPRTITGQGGKVLRVLLCVAPALAVGCWAMYQFLLATSATPENPYEAYR